MRVTYFHRLYTLLIPYNNNCIESTLECVNGEAVKDTHHVRFVEEAERGW